MRALAITVASVALALTACTTPRTVTLYESPSLTGAPYTEPASVVTVTGLYGPGVCIAKDSTGQDPRTFYMRCDR